jgi:hypothetical protein
MLNDDDLCDGVRPVPFHAPASDHVWIPAWLSRAVLISWGQPIHRPQELVAARQWRFKSSLPHQTLDSLQAWCFGGFRWGGNPARRLVCHKATKLRRRLLTNERLGATAKPSMQPDAVAELAQEERQLVGTIQRRRLHSTSRMHCVSNSLI